MLLLTQAIVMQPAAFAFNSTWNVAQQPLFTINPVYPNVVFMISDYSWSMNDYRLPPPTFFAQNNRWPAPGNVTVKHGAGTRTVTAHDEFTLRSSVHNPLAYDPAITYTPWNDNDKPKAVQGTRPNRSENFPDADIGGTGAVAVMTRTTRRHALQRLCQRQSHLSAPLAHDRTRQRRRRRHLRHGCNRQ